MPDAKYLSINAFIDVEDFRLFAKGREVVFDGYTKVQKVNIKDEENLPILEENQILKYNEMKLENYNIQTNFQVPYP